MKGWISLHRRIRDHWIWQEKPFDKRSAWIDLLMMANHQENKFLLGSELIEIQRGSFVTSELKLMERWGWSKTKVRNFLKLLEEDGMLIKKTDKKKTTLTICNYNDYQNSENHKETTREPQKDHVETTERPQEDTNNNDNNYNNENNMLLLSIADSGEETSRDIFPNFYQWVEEKNYIDCKYPNEDPYYLKYLHEKANFYSKTKGKNHPETVGAVKAFENKKASSAEEIILEAQKIS